MGTTNINIQGVSASGSGGNGLGGSNGGQQVIQPQNVIVNAPQGVVGGAGVTSAGGSGYSLPSNERMIEDIRREMRQRGVMMVPGSQSMHKIIDEYAQSQRKIANESITGKYSALGEEENFELEEKLKKRIEKYRQGRFSQLEARGVDITQDKIDVIDRDIERLTPEWRKEIDKESAERMGEIDRKEKEERTQVDKDLTEAIKLLTSYFEREAESGAPRSYLGQLKEERKQLMMERDNATTEEAAISAQEKLNDVNEKIQRVLNPNAGKDGGYNFDALMMSQGLGNMFSSLEQGDIAGSAMGATTAMTSILGMSRKAAMKTMGWVALAVGGARGVMNAFRKGDDLQSLFAILGGVGSGENFDEIDRNFGNESYGIKYSDLGIDQQQFAQLAVNYLTQMGVKSADWRQSTLLATGVEKHFGLQQGQLAKLAKFSRTGIGQGNLNSPAYVMAGLNNFFEGFTDEDHSNAQMVLDTYTSILQSYSSRSNKLNNFNTAGSLMATLAANYAGDKSWSKNFFDERTSGEIATFQNMIQNPANDRMRALIFGEVGKMLGTSDLSEIDKYIINPENELDIMQNVVKKISDLYGGIDTEMGYFAFKELLPNMAPERRKNYIDLLMTGKQFAPENFTNKQLAETAAAYSPNYVSDVTSTTIEIKDLLTRIVRRLDDF